MLNRGGTTVETQPEQPVTPPVHIHSYIATEIKASDADITVGVQYTCYAGDDSYIEWNGNAVAGVGDSYYVELPNAFGQAANDTVILLKNSTLTETIVITENVTFDMDGHTLIFDYDGLLDLYEDGALTVEGNGTMLMEENTSSVLGYLIRMDDDSRLVIQDGQYFTGLTCVQAGGNSVAKIYDGTFDAFATWQEKYWHLNLMDNENAEIIVYGGTFKNYNPAESHTENPVANFVASNYTVTSTQDGEDTWYTVVPRTAEDDGTVAEANGIYYDNLAEALADTNNGTVTVLQDMEISEQLVVNEGSIVTLDLNGKKINSTCTRFSLANYGTLTIEDSGESGAIYNSSKKLDEGNYGHDAVRNFGTLYIEGGYFGDADTNQTNTNDTTYGAAVRNQDGAICVINGGHFTCVDNYGAWADTGNQVYSYAIRNFGTMTINDGEVYGAMNGGVAGDAGSITINDGSFSVTGEKSFHVLTTNTSSDAQITINGGTFTKSGNNNYLLSGFKGMPSWDASDDLEGNGYIVNGGTFIKNDETVIFTQPDV